MQKIGIIIPIYNTQDYLEQCLNSVINQTYKNLEIILVNDGSTNKQCLKIAMEFTKNDERITLIDKINGGQSTARNAGIDFLEGKYKLQFAERENQLYAFKIMNSNPLKIKKIYKGKKFDGMHCTPQLEIPQIDFLQFLDSDDWWALDCVQSCLEKSDIVDIIWYAGEAWFGKNRLDFDSNTRVISNIQFLERMIEKGINYFWCVNFVMIRWRQFEKLKIRFINHIIYEDHIFSIMLFAQVEKIYVLRKSIFYYRIRPNSTSNHNKKIGKEQISPYFEFLLKDFQNNFARTKEYFKAGSVLTYVSNLVDFIKNFPNRTIKSLLSEAFLENYYQWSLIEFSRINEDPLKFSSKISVFSNNIKKDVIKTFDKASKDEIQLWIKQELKNKLTTINTLQTQIQTLNNTLKTLKSPTAKTRLKS
ncbi:glycosyltransferase family 2 protein, partial [Helicobacter turcicus]